MSRVKIVTDSACDLPDKLADELGIDIVPLTIRFGDLEFVDRQDLTSGDFWSRCAASPVLPETAAPSSGAFEKAFRKAATAGYDGIACIVLSSRLSATIQSAQIAAAAVKTEIPVRVIDSLSVTVGLGLIVVAAARLALEGAPLDQVVAKAEEIVPRSRVYAALDTLENLQKGGRIGRAQALLGSMLQVKPIIEVRDGAVEPESRQRTRSKALRRLVELVDKATQQGPIENLAVVHADAPDVDELLRQLSSRYPRQEIIVGEIGPVIGTHSGLRAMGVTFHAPTEEPS
jgi:DegV family protein with EDD domain